MAPGMEAVRCRCRCQLLAFGIGMALCLFPFGCAQLRPEGPLSERLGRSKLGQVQARSNEGSAPVLSEEAGQPEAPWVAQPRFARTDASASTPPGPYEPTDPEARARLASGSPLPTAARPPAQVSRAPREPAPTSGPDEYQTIDELIQAGQDQLSRMPNYQVFMTRQERVGQELLPSEKVVLSIRRQPRAVRIEWREGPNQGREVLYAPRETDGLMYIKMVGQGLVPPLRLAPNSPLALRNSRHPINEAGFETIFGNLEENLRSVRASAPNSGTLSYEGLETPEAIGRACHKIVRVSPSGETYRLYLDQQTALPVLVHASKGGQLLEYYQFHDIQAGLPELAQPEAFDPNVRFVSASNVLGRLVRAAGEVSAQSAESLSP